MQNNKKPLTIEFENNFPNYWGEACNYLANSDETMAMLIDKYSNGSLSRNSNGFHTLARSIVGQQVSVQAADSIWNKLEALLQSKIKPQTYLLQAEENLKKCGLSKQKVNYLKNIAEFFVNNYPNKLDLHKENHSKLESELINIKGVGSWTVEMFMMFHVNAPDIFPLKDIGLLKGFELNYNFSRKEGNFMDELQKYGEVWKPYRTVATWYLWRSIDPVAVQY